MHGVSDSGKTTISDYAGEIFDSHDYKNTRGIFDEKISREGAHK